MTDLRARIRRWLGRIVCSLIFLVAVHATIAGAAARQESAKIADVGEWVYNLQDGGAANPIYKYEGLLVSGELLLQDYRDALAALKAFVRSDEHLGNIYTHPNRKDTHFGFLTARTSFESDRYRGRIIYLQKVEGRFRVVGESGWIE
jgi:hypothetical protein